MGDGWEGGEREVMMVLGNWRIIWKIWGTWNDYMHHTWPMRVKRNIFLILQNLVGAT